MYNDRSCNRKNFENHSLMNASLLWKYPALVFTILTCLCERLLFPAKIIRLFLSDSSSSSIDHPSELTTYQEPNVALIFIGYPEGS